MMRKKILGILLFTPFAIWTLPQFIIGLALSFVWRTHELKFDPSGYHVTVCRTRFTFAFSLAQFVFAPTCCNDDVLRHEIGHTMQSRYLGWIYLIVIGLPSFVLFCVKRAMKKDDRWYHSKFPESWANKLAQVHSEFYP